MNKLSPSYPFAELKTSDISSISILIAVDTKIIDDEKSIRQYLHALSKIPIYGENPSAKDYTGGVQRLDTLTFRDGKEQNIVPSAQFIWIDGVSYDTDHDATNYLDYVAYVLSGRNESAFYFGLPADTKLPFEEDADNTQ